MASGVRHQLDASGDAGKEWIRTDYDRKERRHAHDNMFAPAPKDETATVLR